VKARVTSTPITTVLIALALGSYVSFGPGAFDTYGPGSGQAGFGTVLLNLLRHQDLFHLLTNLALLAWAGYPGEARAGSPRWGLLVLASAILPALAEFLLVDARFLGLSGVAFATVTLVVLNAPEPRDRRLGALMLAAALAFDIFFARGQTALVVHTFAIAVGAVFSMLGSLFGGGKPKLVPMKLNHLSQVVQIIAQTDEDDALEAEESLISSNCAGMFVLLDRRKVVGVTGANAAEGSDDAFWLSWTYLDWDWRGQGWGQFMIDELLRGLDEVNVRKIFIASSDYEENGAPIYAASHKFYTALGAAEELMVPDYHNPGEAQLIFGLINPRVNKTADALPDAPAGVSFGAPFPAPESEGVYALNWQVEGQGVQGLEDVVREVAEKGGRGVVTALPSDVSALAGDQLQNAGFEQIGALRDFYDTGFDQIWWQLPLNSAA
jgi:membrane associated rhomboid family serine protease/GNAT superfamily N-acetyltransferase